MSFNLSLDQSTKDLILSSRKNLSLIYSPNLTAQRIECRLRVIKGEWFLNSTLGIPFFTQILIKTRDKSKVDSIFKSEILSIPEIIKIEQFVSELSSSREYSITKLSIKTEDRVTVFVRGV